MHVEQEEVWVALSNMERPELGDFAYGIAPVAWLESYSPPVDFCRLHRTVINNGDRLVPLRTLTRNTENDTRGILCVYWHQSLMLWPVTDKDLIAQLRQTMTTPQESLEPIEGPEVAATVTDLVAQSRFLLDLQRIKFGMTLKQVETIMGRYKDLDLTSAERSEADKARLPTESEIESSRSDQIAMSESVLYRYTDNTAFSVVRFKDGRAVGIVFSPE